MAKLFKSNISYMPVVEGISRKFALRRETCSNKTVGKKIIAGKSWMGGSVRTYNLPGYGTVSKNVFVIRKFGNIAPATPDQVQVRHIFEMANKAVAVQMKDLMQITTIQQLYLGGREDLTKTVAGVSVKGYTYRGWISAVNYARKKADATLTQEQLNQFPTAYDA